MKDNVAALLGLEQQLRKATNLAQLFYTIVNQTHRCVPYTQAVLLCGHNVQRLEVVAASDISSVDYTSPFVSWIERLYRAGLASFDGSCQQLLTPESVPAELAADWHDMVPSQLLWQPLVAEARDGEIRGVLLLFRETPWTEAERGLCGHLATSMGHALFALQRYNPLKGLWQKRRNKRWGVAAVALVFAVMWWPVRLSTLAPLEVIPRDPMVIAAPIDGVVREVVVNPSQPVGSGDVLVHLQDAELASEFEVAQQALLVAEAELKTIRQSGFSDPRQNARIAELEARVNLRRAEANYAAARLDKATILAPGDGVTVMGDPAEWKGRPVRVGERILLVADTQKVELEVMLPVKDSVALRERAEMKVFFDNNPLGSRTAWLKHGAYEPQKTIDETMAYRLVAELEPGEGENPRIGMRGTVRIYGEKVTLFYYLFRRPITSFRQWLGW
ncbi:hypothetical protein C7I36_16270 [Zobellella taiwanensis]|uniref:HlyD family secretion protein n=1 Tax=Zobellella taiwanensis TaxID=347535 RepID=A0A2P7QG65_9GAMM|nr:HlyD family efflux transporter periplasmic adaptor subunit [Zobellella taiwanensis]PSJ36958.1 hypothetical protein C7I36_16270 [Zobellella taiwanensis]